MAVVTGVVGACLLSFAGATSEVTVSRLSGNDRFETAAAIARDTFTTASTALVARGDQFADALAGNYLAGRVKGPILLTAHGSVPAPTKQALSGLGVKDVVLLGGTAAISPAVEQELKASGMNVRRIGGNDRYETARLIALDAAASVGSVDGKKTALLATGERFPDALAGGPASYTSALPTLLTASSSLSPAAKAALADLDIDQVIILGGTAAVSSATESQASAATGSPAVRISGSDRTETAANAAEYWYAHLSFDQTHVNLARGDDFPDALAGGPHAGSEGGTPIVLTANPGSLGPATSAFFAEHNATISSIDVLGGPAAVSDAAANEAKAAATCRPASTTTSSGPTTTSTTTAPTSTLPNILPTTTAPTTSTTAPSGTTSTSGPSTGSTTTTVPVCRTASSTTSTTGGSGGSTTSSSSTSSTNTTNTTAA